MLQKIAFRHYANKPTSVLSPQLFNAFKRRVTFVEERDHSLQSGLISTLPQASLIDTEFLWEKGAIAETFLEVVEPES